MRHKIQEPRTKTKTKRPLSWFLALLSCVYIIALKIDDIRFISMKRLLILSLIVPCFLCSFGQLHSYNKAYIWRGFEHQWTYNHRCNHLGDYVQYNSGTPVSVHASATGTGADSTYFTSYYTYVASKDVVFKEGEAVIKIKARKNRLFETIVTVTVPAEDWLKNKTDYITLLNGFDLRSDKAADKLQLLRFSLENGVYVKDSDQIRFSIDVTLVLACQSAECAKFEPKVDYDLNIHYLIVGLNKGEAAATGQFFTRSYPWGRKGELEELPVQKSIVGDATPVYPEATVGIKSFSVVLNEANWLLSLHNDITPVSYDPQQAEMKLSIDMLFKEWEEGMKGSDAAPWYSKFSVKRKGWAIMDVDALLLQFRQAKITYGKHSGCMFWRGKFGSPNGDLPKDIFDLPGE
jgi:hypothetical protein